MKTIKLDELFTPAQWSDISLILHGHADPLVVTSKLKQYFVDRREQLEAKGVCPEYLAYALPYWLEHQPPDVPVPRTI